MRVNALYFVVASKQRSRLIRGTQRRSVYFAQPRRNSFPSGVIVYPHCGIQSGSRVPKFSVYTHMRTHILRQIVPPSPPALVLQCFIDKGFSSWNWVMVEVRGGIKSRSIQPAVYRVNEFYEKIPETHHRASLPATVNFLIDFRLGQVLSKAWCYSNKEERVNLMEMFNASHWG